MRFIFTIVFFFFSLYLFAQQKKVCQPLHVIFKNYQKNSLNLSMGIGLARTKVDVNRRQISGQLGINYFPAKYLETGLKIKPTMALSKDAKEKILLENNLYLRYYPLFISCYKVAVFSGASVSRDGSKFSVKGEPISENKLFPAVMAGLVIAPKPYLQIEVYSEIFFNRPVRHNLGLVWNFKSYQLKQGKANKNP